MSERLSNDLIKCRFQNFLEKRRAHERKEDNPCVMGAIRSAIGLIRAFGEGKDLDDMEFEEIDRLMFSGNTFDASIVIAAFALGLERAAEAEQRHADNLVMMGKSLRHEFGVCTEATGGQVEEWAQMMLYQSLESVHVVATVGPVLPIERGRGE